jgi:protocatechuate 3,4-dioxygenase beta subunit
LKAAWLEVWQADAEGRYDNEDDETGGEQLFINRARIRCDEDGRFEFETVRPGAYARKEVQHAAHIHFYVMASGYVPCMGQLLFSDDEYLDQDPYREWSTVVELKEMERNGKKYKEGAFDIVLAPEE